MDLSLKHFMFACALMGTVGFVSCHSSSSEVEEQCETVDYTFNCFSMDQGSIGELSTRAMTAETTYSILAVDVKDGQYVQSVSRMQVSADEALTNLTIPLRVGTHQIYFICSTQPWHYFDENALLVSWNEQTAGLGDTWAASVSVNVVAGAAQTKNVTLSRAVAYVRISIQDALPANISSFRQNLVGGSWCYNLLQQSGDVAAQLSRSINVPSSMIGQVNIGVGMYTFIPSGATAANRYTVTALNADGGTIQSISFDNVPLVQNQYTTYQGNYFSYGASFQISLEADWKAPNVIDF